MKFTEIQGDNLGAPISSFIGVLQDRFPGVMDLAIDRLLSGGSLIDTKLHRPADGRSREEVKAAAILLKYYCTQLGLRIDWNMAERGLLKDILCECQDRNSSNGKERP